MIDAVAFILVLGASFAALVEAAVLMYHFSAPDAAKQARWMIVSMAIQLFLLVVFFVALPMSVLDNLDLLEGLAIGFVVIIGLLALVEAKMLTVKWAIVKHARKKAESQYVASQIETEVNALAVLSTFNHCM